MSQSKPTIALFTGDPAGIGPELIEKLLSRSDTQEKANIILIGQKNAFDFPAYVKVHNWSGFNAPAFKASHAGVDNGAYMMSALAEGVQLVQSGQADALCFAPLNKTALRLGGMHAEDELRWFAELMKFEGVCGELNVLENLWTARVTSHVALKEVSHLITAEKVAEAILMIDKSLKATGIAKPRLAVCGLNPHNGDNGNFGDEEIRVIAPGVQLAAEQGVIAEGPFPADTAFVRAIRKPDGYDGVVTMYHDQGQIAMKLMGFEKGVTIHGGLPIPISTPAHGTAYDITGLGKANVGAMVNAFDLACKMGLNHKKI
jgi:4-hydroxy-L-threonine phosphate dehydrogenase PdxA